MRVESVRNYLTRIRFPPTGRIEQRELRLDLAAVSFGYVSRRRSQCRDISIVSLLKTARLVLSNAEPLSDHFCVSADFHSIGDCSTLMAVNRRHNGYVFVAGISNCEFVPAFFIFLNRELAEEHLMGAETSVGPGVEVSQNFFADFELRGPVDNTDLVAHQATELLDHDFAFGDVAFENFLNLDCYVGINAAVQRVDFAFDG